MPYFTMTEIAENNNITTRELTKILSAKSCIYKNPKTMKTWNVYDTFTKGITSPYKRCGGSILWSDEMVNKINKIVKSSNTQIKPSVVTESTLDSKRYLRKYFDKTYGAVFQMTRQTKGKGEYAILSQAESISFTKDCDALGIRSNGKMHTKLLILEDNNYGKWNRFLSQNLYLTK